jgi:hypothetical protein
LLLIPLGSGFIKLLSQARQDNTRDSVEKTIEQFLTSGTLTFGDKEKVDVEKVDIDWDQNPPVVRVIVRVVDPERPTFKQVSAVQEEINKRQGLRFRLVVQRTAVDIVGPKEKPNTQTPTSKQLINSDMQERDEIETIHDTRPFKDVPKIENMPFLDNMRLIEGVEKNDPNSTSDLEEIKTQELPLDNQTAGQSLN